MSGMLESLLLKDGLQLREDVLEGLLRVHLGLVQQQQTIMCQRFKCLAFTHLINYDQVRELTPQMTLSQTSPFRLNSQCFQLHMSSPSVQVINNNQRMETLRKENQELKQGIENILEEIQQQRVQNSQHEKEIETLLKFNERLLSIIENQMGNKHDGMSLQPISERSQRESDLIGPALSLIKSRHMAARSQRGQNTAQSLIGTKKTLAGFDKEKQTSEINHSYDHEDLSEKQLQQKTAYPALGKPSWQAKEVGKVIQSSSAVKQEMSEGIKELQEFKQNSMQFYDQKIGQIKGLSSKLGHFEPMDKLKQISQKLTLSQGTSKLIQQALSKKQGKA